MTTYFINPYLLWGTLAVAIPIIIHFWHQKRGTILPWAVTQWLVEKNQQQQRGLKFDNLVLMLVRSLLVLLLAVLLSQPILNWFARKEAVQPIHLVEPSALLVDAFRFELEDALKKGEKVYWATAEPEPATTLAVPRQTASFTPLTLQSAINTLETANRQLHLYVLNTQHLADVPFLFVPTHFRLHTRIDSTRGQRNFLASAPTKLFVDAANRLTSGPVLPPAVRFASAATHEGRLSVLLDFRDKTERQTVTAALAALTDVYKLDLAVADQKQPGQLYDVVLTDRLPTTPLIKTLYVVSGSSPAATTANVITVSDAFTPKTSDIVAGGQLPEWLGEQLVAWFGLNPIPAPLSQQQLDALFVPAQQPAKKPSGNDDDTSTVTRGGLLLLIILLTGVERWLALTKNA